MTNGSILATTLLSVLISLQQITPAIASPFDLCTAPETQYCYSIGSSSGVTTDPCIGMDEECCVPGTSGPTCETILPDGPTVDVTMTQCSNGRYYQGMIDCDDYNAACILKERYDDTLPIWMGFESLQDSLFTEGTNYLQLQQGRWKFSSAHPFDVAECYGCSLVDLCGEADASDFAVRKLRGRKE